MRKIFAMVSLVLSFVVCVSSQVHRSPRTTPTPSQVPVKPPTVRDPDLGTLVGRTYSNKKYKFQLVFPDSWLVPDGDFEDYMKSRGFDLGLKAPETLTSTSQAKVNQALKNVTVLVTGYRSLPGTPKNAVMRVSIEDLSLKPQIDDAVDYFDAMRVSFQTLKLPEDFKYSETQAEKLGAMQFGFLDASTKVDKRRMYATVSNGHAILFTLTYSADEDLATMRHILEIGNFDYK